MVLFGGTAVFSPSEIPHKKIIPKSELQFFVDPQKSIMKNQTEFARLI